MSEVGKAIVQAIDAQVEADQGDGLRTHLGASFLGRRCSREIWYRWRWFKIKAFSGRMLRLFARGHLEEQRFVEYLDKIGGRIRRFDENGKQFLFSDLGGHIGGSGDGLVTHLDAFGLTGTGLLEFKTHGEKSFLKLKQVGLVSAKIEHYVQMQLYMGYFKLAWGLYFAVNKNTDELHCEWVQFKPEVHEMYRQRGIDIVGARRPPPRISNDRTWWECKFCDYHEICHHNEVPAKNCRTCIYSDAKPDATWYCEHWRATIPPEAMRQGCGDHVAIMGN
jgi:hypothetical protein